NAVSCFISGIARLPARAALCERAAWSKSSALQFAPIADAEAGEKTPTCDSASASAASKSSIPCKVAESENTVSTAGHRNRESSRFMRRVYALLQSNKRIHDITYRFEEKRVAKTGLTVQMRSSKRIEAGPWALFVASMNPPG